MPNIDRLNEDLQHELAVAINREAALPGILITVSYVRVSMDLKWATVGISVLPDHFAGTALRELKKQASLLAEIISKKIRLRHIPRFRFEFDPTERQAAVIENFMDNLDEKFENDETEFIKID